MDDFLIRALLAGIGLTLVTGPLGCFVVWRRLAYFGDTMAHSALLGLVLGMILERYTAIPSMVGVILIIILIAMTLLILQRNPLLASDTMLGILSHGTLALGLVSLGLIAWLPVDLWIILFGDILAISWGDLGWIYGGGILVLGLLFWIWQPLLALTINADLAQADDLPIKMAEFVFLLNMAVVIAMAIRLVGVLLIVALLIIPAATARSWAHSPEAMAGLAVLFGISAVILGLIGSLYWDTASSPSIVLAGLMLFLLSMFLDRIFGHPKKMP